MTGSAYHLTNLDAIQVNIQKALSKERFLLVLDDVWNDNCNDWDALRAPLMVGARGSRILVTTRSQRVSSIMGTVPAHSLQGLSDDDCWSLFKIRAFVEGNSDAYPDLVMIGKEIVNKCKGLPLAVKTLGGLLRYKVDAVEWEAMLNSEIWDLPEERNDILPALRLSYHHLPAHLKRCFAYCCVFPKGSKVEGNQLVLMWMAQGFIQSKVSNHMEESGREYLSDLVSRSLLNCVYTSYYTMHDLTHDLASSVSGADVLEIGDGKSLRNAEKARYMSEDRNTESDNFEDFFCLKSLCTLRLFCTRNIPADLFVHLRHIRILHLCGYHITELPESIGNLLQLRLFYLSWTKIERLPKSVTRLYNLQALKIEYCSQLVELPSDLSNLVNLRYLSLRGCAVSIPPRIGRLTSLQMLEVFNVGKDIGCGINELKDIIHLGGSLCISKLENVVNAQEAKVAELKKKQKVHKLQLEWKSYDVESRQEGIEEEVLKGLQPHTNLKELEIEGYCGVTFPTWLADSSFSNLVSVRLSSCKCHLLPPFGQLPSLKCLNLFGLYGLKKVGRDCPPSKRMAYLKALQAIAILGLLSNNIKNRIYELRAFCVMPFGPIISGAGLSEDEVVGAEDLTIRSRSDAVHGSRLQIHENGSWHVSSTRRLVVVDIDPLELQIGGPALVAASGIDAVLFADYFPELGSDLVSTLAALDVEDFSHFGDFFVRKGLGLGFFLGGGLWRRRGRRGRYGVGWE